MLWIVFNKSLQPRGTNIHNIIIDYTREGILQNILMTKRRNFFSHTKDLLTRHSAQREYVDEFVEKFTHKIGLGAKKPPQTSASTSTQVFHKSNSKSISKLYNIMATTLKNNHHIINRLVHQPMFTVNSS